MILRRLVSTSPVAVKRSPITIIIDELSPVSGRDSAFFTFVILGTVVAVATVVVGDVVVVGATVVGVGALFGSVGVAVGATGDPVRAFDVGESPIPFTALMVTE